MDIVEEKETQWKEIDENALTIAERCLYRSRRRALELYQKGKSALMIYDRHPELQNKWNKAFWARGYYVATVGNVTEDAIKRYIQEQYDESKEEDGAAFERQ